MTSTPQQLPHSLEAAHAAIISAQSVIATLSEKLSQTVRENELLKQKIDKLCRRLFGKSSEKVSPDQLALAFAQLPQDAATETDLPATESVEGAEDAAGETVRARPSPTGRKAFPKHLPRQRVLVMPADEELTCGCGQRKTQIAEKVTERLDYVPASAVVVETVRPVFVCEKCHDGVTVAPAPTQAVDGSAAGSGLLAYIIVSKYVDHLPLNRLERIFARQGVELSRSTMCGQLALAEEALAPLGKEIVRRLRAGPYLQFDDTSVLVKKLYEIEEEARGLGHDERRTLRQERATPLLRELMRLARAMGPSVLPKSPLGEALTYLRNQMRYVAQYIRDGRLEIDNNGAERQLRGVAVGRKNWLFAGSMKGLHRAALLYSLVQSAKLAGVEPWAYLKDVLDRLPNHPHSRISELLPKQWAATRPAAQPPAAAAKA